MTQDEALDYILSSLTQIPEGAFHNIPEEEEKNVFRARADVLCMKWVAALNSNPNLKKPDSYAEMMAICVIAIGDGEKIYKELNGFKKALVQKKVAELQKPKLVLHQGGEEKTERPTGHLELV